LLAWRNRKAQVHEGFKGDRFFLAVVTHHRAPIHALIREEGEEEEGEGRRRRKRR
jgi:hypothetical protein